MDRLPQKVSKRFLGKAYRHAWLVRQSVAIFIARRPLVGVVFRSRLLGIAKGNCTTCELLTTNRAERWNCQHTVMTGRSRPTAVIREWLETVIQTSETSNGADVPGIGDSLSAGSCEGNRIFLSRPFLIAGANGVFPWECIGMR